MGEQLNDDNVFHLLDLCEKFSVNNLRTLCAEFLADNFGALLKADKLQELDPETWAEMLKSDEIQVTSEEEVFNAVMRYSAQFDKEKRIKALETVLPIVFQPLSHLFLSRYCQTFVFPSYRVLSLLRTLTTTLY